MSAFGRGMEKLNAELEHKSNPGDGDYALQFPQIDAGRVSHYH